MDWGLARRMGPDGDALDTGIDLPEPDDPDAKRHSRTRIGAVVGTPAYMSPEQAAGKHPELDARSDIYAMGLILQECASLRSAVDGPTMEAVLIMAMYARREPLTIGDGKGAVPREIEAIIRKATHLRPERPLPLGSRRSPRMSGATSVAKRSCPPRGRRAPREPVARQAPHGNAHPACWARAGRRRGHDRRARARPGQDRRGPRPRAARKPNASRIRDPDPAVDRELTRYESALAESRRGPDRAQQGCLKATRRRTSTRTLATRRPRRPTSAHRSATAAT